MTFEYAVWDNLDNSIHRGPWSEEECIEWIDYCRDSFSAEAIEKLWSVRRRAVGEWETYDEQSVR